MKKKVAIIVILIAGLYSVSNSYAFVDAGTILQSWYNSVLDKSTKSITDKVVNPGVVDMQNTMSKFSEDLISEAQESIKNFADQLTRNSISEIQVRENFYVEQIEAKKQELIGRSRTELNPVIGNLEQNTLKNQGLAVENSFEPGTVIEDFNQYVSDNNERVNEEIDDAAKQYLQEAISEINNAVLPTQ